MSGSDRPDAVSCPESEQDALNVLQRAASNAWKQVKVFRVFHAAAGHWRRNLYRPTPVELNVLQQPTLWRKFSELMEGTTLAWTENVKTGAWSIDMVYNPQTAPKNDFAKRMHRYCSDETIAAQKRVQWKEDIVIRLKGLRLPSKQNVLYMKNGELELLEEIAQDNHTVGLPDMKGYSIISPDRAWILWENDTRQMSNLLSDACVIL